MISREEADTIAHEYIDGVILQENCSALYNMSYGYPMAWKYTIYHRNQDKDVFITHITVTNKGVVSEWNKKHISEEEEE